MNRPARLTESEIETRLGEAVHWQRRANALHRSLQFEDFAEAFGFMARIALIAEAMEHHPNWSNVWNRVEVELSTHDAGGITVLDFELAEKIDRVLGAP